MPDARRSLSRISSVVTTAVPAVTGVTVGTVGDPATVLVQPPELQAAAQPIINGFDWSAAAQAAWEDDRVPERKSLRDTAAQAIADNAAYLAIASPTAAQVRTQTEALTRQVNRLIRRLIQLD